MKIFLTTDFLMTNEKEQLSNLKWLSHMITRPIGSHQIVNFVLPDYDEMSDGRNNRNQFFQKLGLDFCHDEVQLFFSADKVTESALDYVRNFLDCDLIIGYEFSEQTRKILDHLDVTYIDIWLHPIRYLDDVVFGFRSNSEKIQEKIASFGIDEELFNVYADMLKVQNYRGFRRFKNQLIPKSALFIGQTLKDKAIFSDGKMLTILDFKEKFKEYTQSYNRVYYSRHPFIKEGDENILNYLSRFSNVEIIFDPSYNLLASDEIEKVFSISSSVVHEAHFFGKQTEFLYKPIFETFNRNDDALSDPDRYIPIMHAFLFNDFWSHLLMGEVLKPNKQYYIKNDLFRDTLSFYWGYRDIDKLESLKQTVSRLYKTVNAKKV